MAKVKFTKTELRNQKDDLKMFQRYLPTLVLKKQQLQMVIYQVKTRERELEIEMEKIFNSIMSWVDVFGEDIKIDELITVKSIERGTGNIAGVDIPVFKNLIFEPPGYDLFSMPLWIDEGTEKIKTLSALYAEIEVLKEQRNLLADELRTTTQRVNLFEKIKIPETKENIRKIQIYMGDQQTAAVVRGKIAKLNIVKVS